MLALLFMFYVIRIIFFNILLDCYEMWGNTYNIQVDVTFFVIMNSYHIVKIITITVTLYSIL